MSSIPDSLDAIPKARAQALSPAAVVAVVVALALVVPLVMLPTTLGMVEIWTRSETFAHGFVIFPIFAFLVWRLRYTLSAIVPRPFAPALVGMTLAGSVWWVSVELSAQAPAQVAMVCMTVFAMWTALGTQMMRAIAFPVAFLFFAVPVGEFLVPVMMDWTADFTVLALRASGVPVYRELNHLMIPTGMWSVVEACSGLRYLIASITVGTLFAYLTYRTAWRRAAFIVASVLVPVFANWLRAYLIVMIGHLSNNRLAVGVDHLIYGWVFFGIVMLLLFWIGSRWRDSTEPDRRGAGAAAAAFRVTPAMLASVLAVALLALAWQAAGGKPEPRDRQVLPLPALHVDGWTSVAEPLTAFRPEVTGQSAELFQTFERNGTRVALQLFSFSDQQPGYQALSTRNHIVWSNTAWMKVQAATATGPVGSVNTAVLSRGGERLAAWQWFWVDGRTTDNEYVGQIYRVLGLIQRRPDTAAWVLVYVPTGSGEPEVRSTLQDFVAAAAPAIDAALAEAGKARP